MKAPAVGRGSLTSDRGDTHIERLRHPLQWLKSWAQGPAPSRSDQVLLGFVGAIVAAGIGGLIGLLLSLADLLDGKLSAAFAVAAGGIGLLVGAMVSVLLARNIYLRPRLRLKDKELQEKTKEFDSKTTDLKDKLDAKEAEIARLNVYRDAARRHEAYAQHIHLLLRELQEGGIASEEDSLLLAPATLIEEATGTKVRFSVWTQTTSTIASKPKWKIEWAPDHPTRQSKKFEVLLQESWLAFVLGLTSDSDEEKDKHPTKDSVFGSSDIEREKSQRRDLEVLAKEGFKSYRCTSISDPGDHDCEMRCLVALAEVTDAFDETEDWYIAFLGQILALNRGRTQPTPDSKDSDPDLAS